MEKKKSGFINIIKEKIMKKKKEEKEKQSGTPDWMKGNEKALRLNEALKKKREKEERRKREFSGPTKY